MTLFAVAFVSVLGYAMSSSYQWVELDGGDVFGPGERNCPDHEDCEQVVCLGSHRPPKNEEK